MKILIVEDDKVIAEQIAIALEKWNYETLIASDFLDITAEFSAFMPDLVLMDIILPYYNGYHHCAEIRKISTVPIVFISSKSEDMDIIMAMQFGGDDYITKPISTDVLLAKIAAILRRSYQMTDNTEKLTYDDITYTINTGTIEYRNKNIELSKTEMMIIESLIRAQGGIVSRESLIEKCWHGDDFIDDNTLAVNITRLRKKLKTIGVEDLIQTKKGRGYQLKKSGE